MEPTIIDKLRNFKNALITSFRYHSGQSDLDRWEKLSALLPEWDERNRLIATFIEPGSSVIEFGAGRMVLKKFLPESCSYTPSDIVDRGEGTIVIDLNAQQLPDFPPHDVAVLSGVIEYVNNVPRLLAQLAGTVRVILVSYGLRESFPNKIERRAHGWVNDFSAVEFEKLFTRCGYVVEAKNTWQSQTIYKFILAR